jgi:hypothetical protein
LAFLDVKITKNRSKLVTSVYRKATDSGRYLHYKSNHPRSVKVGVAACLLNRAESHCGTEIAKKEERKTIITTLKNNGYPHTVFIELLRKENRRKKWRRETGDGLQKCGNNSIHCRIIRSHHRGGG